MTPMMSPIQVQQIRTALWEHGFRPVEVKTGSRAPVQHRWPELARKNPPALGWPSSGAMNTGILCDGLIVIDVDVDDPAIVSQIVKLVTEQLGPAPSRIRADSARCLMLYRAAEGEPKKRILKNKDDKDGKDGKDGKVEVLGYGNQFVAFGTRDDGADYEWPDGGPDKFSRDALTPVSEDALQKFLCAIAPLIGAALPAVRSVAASEACYPSQCC